MTQREKVIADLNFSKTSTIDGYAAHHYGGVIHGITTETLCDALTLLKAQEPRVMTLEYFDNSPDKDSKGCLVAWVEYRRDEEWAEYWEGTCDEWSVIRRDDFYSGESYRFWTSRPTDEQREAVKWE